MRTREKNNVSSDLLLSKKCSRFSLILIIVLLSVSIKSLTAEEIKYNSPEYWFEEAYHLESLSPSYALEIYQYAMETFPAKLKKAALWRVYFLHVESGNFALAFIDLLHLREEKFVGKKIDKIFEKLKDASEKAWGIERAKIDLLFDNVLEKIWLASKNEDLLTSSLQELLASAQVKKKERKVFVNQIIAVCLAKKNYRLAIEVSTQYSTRERLDIGWIYIQQKKYLEAAQILRKNRSFATLIPLEDKVRRNYLLGIIARENKQYSQSNRYFYRAMQKSKVEHRVLYYNLIAYNYFLDNKRKLALETLETAPIETGEARNNDAFFLRNILEYAKTSDKQILKKLAPYKSYIRYRRNDKSNPIIQETWILLNRSAA